MLLADEPAHKPRRHSYKENKQEGIKARKGLGVTQMVLKQSVGGSGLPGWGWLPVPGAHPLLLTSPLQGTAQVSSLYPQPRVLPGRF